MLAELLGKIALQVIGLFIKKAEDKEAAMKAIMARLRELDGASLDAANLRQKYDDAAQRVRDRQNGKPPT